MTGQGAVERTGDAIILLLLAAAGWAIARYVWPAIPRDTR